MYKVAILLATYNGRDYLIEQLSSIYSLESVIFKIFLSDHNSVDNTKSLFTQFCEKNDIDFKIIDSSVPFRGAGQNFFHLIREVDTENYDYYAFADQDDIWLPQKLIHAIKQIKKSKTSGYSSSVKSFTSRNNFEYIYKYPNQKKYDYFFQSPGPGCTFVVTKDFFKDLKSFLKLKTERMKNIYYHDWFIYAFARHFNYDWFIDSISLIYYRQHNNNDTGASSSIYSKFKRFKLLWNNWAFEQALSISTVLGFSHKLKIFYKYYPFNLIILFFTIRHYRRDFLNSIILFLMVVFRRFRLK